MMIKTTKFCFLLYLIFFSLNASAGIVLSGTRLVFNGNKNETSIEVTNPDPKPFLIQTWVSSFDDKKADNFIVTPPIFRMDANASNVIRIILEKDTLPKDKESLFWLNVKAIPSSDPNAKDSLLIAINTKIKLIYRPASLISKDANAAYQELIFKIDTDNQEITASNPTAYFINLSDLTYNGRNIDDPGVIPPFGHVTWKVNSSQAGAHKVSWNAINDFGGTTTTLSKNID